MGIPDKSMLPIEGTQLHAVDFEGNDYSGGERILTGSLSEATVISSQMTVLAQEDYAPRSTTAGVVYHKPILDIDFPAKLIESSTPGHYHLYFDKPVEHGNYMRLLRALAEAGIIEEGYYRASERRGYTSARLPWIKK